MAELFAARSFVSEGPARSLVAAEDQPFATTVRNLLLYGLLLHLFAFEATTLFTSATESELVADASSDAGNLYNQLILPAAFGAVCILVYAYRVPVRVLSAAMLPMTPLLLVIAFSITWSAYPELTFRRASHEIVEATTLALLACCFTSANAVLVIFFRAFLIVGCLDLLSSVIFPNALTSLGLAGIHGHKNVAGQFFFAAIPVYFLGTLYTQICGKRWIALFALLCGIGMLILSESKTSLGATVFGFACVLIVRGLSQRDFSARAPWLLVCALGLICTIIAFVVWPSDELLEKLVGDPTLTGRDGIWNYAISKFDENPMGGAGYGAIWQIGAQIQPELKEMGIFLLFNEAHNGYLEIAAQLGIIGTLCLVIFLGTTLLNTLWYWVKVEKHSFYGAGALSIYLFSGLALSNITESLYFQAGIGSFGILIFMAALVAGRTVSRNIERYE
jgi:exopolysaccharide production protein ExoQ